MGRARRSDLTQPMLHIWSRGVDRQDIFTNDRDRLVMEQLLGATVERFGIEVHAYAFMHNHLHLLADRRDGDISSALRFALAQYASYFNRSTERTGPVFSGRFGATEIETDQQAMQCSRYVHLNPVEFVPLRSITAYRWSSLGVYAEVRRAPDWLTTDFIPEIQHASTADYVRFVLTPQPSDRHGRPTRPWVVLTLSMIDDVVAETTSEFPGRTGSRGLLNTSASIAIGLAIELRVGSSSEIAAHHGLSAPVSARTAARRARVRASTDPLFHRTMATARDRLAALLTVRRPAA